MGKQGRFARPALVFALSMASACVGRTGHGANTPFGPSRPPPKEDPNLYAGDAKGPPTVQGLPESDVPRDSLSEDMQRAWRLVEESLAVPPPAEPADRSNEALSRWSDTVLRQWMARKSEVVMAAREALDEAAVHSERERILAGALLGLTCEDAANVLVGLPMPEELESEPEVAAIYDEVLISQAKPYLANADAAYKACAANAKDHGLLLHWGRYCARRAEGLPGKEPEPEAPPPPSDTTEVTVTRE